MGIWNWLFGRRKVDDGGVTSRTAALPAPSPPRRERKPPSAYLLDLRGTGATSIPADNKSRRIIAAECADLYVVEPGLACRELDLSKTPIDSLPSDLRVDLRLDLTDCKRLEALPEGLRTGSLVLRGCTALRDLPAGLEVSFLDIQGCTALTHIPDDLRIQAGQLNARDCTRLRGIPASVGPIAQLDLAGCTGISELPEGLIVTSWVDIARTGIRQLPKSMEGIQIRWRSVVIEERIAFRPEEIGADEVLKEPNAERRRVLLDRVGFERFVTEAGAKELDRDRDAGGERRLLQVDLEGDEPLVCVSVICPSTGRQYLIRVPPTMKTCRQAVAWTAGFDDAKHYNPSVET